MHINLFADLIIASFLPVGAISALYYADRLNQLPLGVVGIAMGTALLPMLSLAIAKANPSRAKELFNQALEACVFFALPAALALFLLSDFIISVLFERGAFDAESTRRSSFALMGYCVGLTPYVASKVLSTVFWANKDTWTPVKISIKITVLNIILSLILVVPFQEAGIALSTGLVGWLQFFLLKRASRGYNEAQLTSGFYQRIIKLLASALIMSAIVFAAAWLLRPLFTHGLSEFILLGGIVFIGIASYLASVFLLRIYRLRDIKNLFVKPQN
jgi:putative peptidoglycan lipid II flippase